MLLGNIGGEQRYEYRAVGDIVNTASRIQGLNQLLGTRVLLSATTLADVEFSARDVGTFLLRGKRLPVTVFEPIATGGCRLDARAVGEFAAALALFRRGDWEAAQASFAVLAARFPADGPCRYYDAMTGALRQDPPAAWTGAVRITAK
jgi:adenylate cyclase